MKRLMILGVFGALVACMSGCRVAECWRYAWNSRFHPQQTMVVAEPCVVTDSPCCESSCCEGAVVTTPPCASCAQ
jgi:hypothetical protein